MDFEPVFDPARPAGFRLDIGVFDEAGPPCALGDEIGFGEALPDVALDNLAARQHVAFPADLNGCGVSGCRCRDADDRRLLAPRNRQVFVAQGRDRAAVADDGEHGLAPVADDPVGEHRLVLADRVNAERVAARDVVGGQHGGDTRPGRPEGVEIAGLEPAAGDGRADDP